MNIQSERTTESIPFQSLVKTASGICINCHHDHVNGYTQELQIECTDLDYTEDGEPDQACYCVDYNPDAISLPR